MVTEVSNKDDPHTLLEWHLAAGVDFAVGEAPVDQFAASKIAPKPTVSPVIPKRETANSAPSPLATPSLQNTDPAEAAALAGEAKTLEELEAVLRDFDGCALKLRATQLVFSDGNPEADVMIIGEAPGRDEDLQGKPFVGRSGQLLDKIIGSIGLDRTKVYIANTVPWRPPGNRTPTPQEVATCRPFLDRQIELVAPKVILTTGAPAAHTMLDTKTPITRLRGQWQKIEIAGLSIDALPTLHPAFLLRQPAQKKLVWRDMLSLKARLMSSD